MLYSSPFNQTKFIDFEIASTETETESCSRFAHLERSFGSQAINLQTFIAAAYYRTVMPNIHYFHVRALYATTARPSSISVTLLM